MIQRGNTVFLLFLIVILVISFVCTGILVGDSEKEKDKEKKKQTQTTESPESNIKSESKSKTKPLPKSKPGIKSNKGKYKRVIIAGERKGYTGEPGTFIFHDAEIKNVLLFFSKTYKLNIVIDPGVSGKVTIRLVNVPWDQALDLILKQNGLAMSRNGNLVTAKKLKK